MSLEPQAEQQPAQPVDNQANVPAMGEHRSLMDVWRVLSKHRLLILVVTILFVAAAAWHAFRTPPVYESVARVEIKPNTMNNVQAESYWEDPSIELQTEVLVIESDSVLLQTAQSLNLLNRLRAAPEGGAGQPAPWPGPTPKERNSLIAMVKSGLSVSTIPNTHVVEIRYRGNDPILAAEIVNRLVETFSDEELETKYERTMHVSVWLQKRLEDLRQEASDTQRQLADYQRTHNIVGADETSNLTLQTLQHISNNLDDAEADRIMKEARMREFNSLNPDMAALMGDDPALAALTTQLNDLESQREQLAAKFGPKHPQMQLLEMQIKKVQAQIHNEVEVAQSQVRKEYEGALATEGALRKRLGAQEDATYRLTEDVAQYAILRHEAELTRTLYDTLQSRLKEASVTAGLSAANITVVDRAEVPLAPIAPRKQAELVLGLLGGLVVACVLAFVIESIDDRLGTSEEVEHASLLPALAAIPHLSYGASKPKGEQKEEAVSGIPEQLITLWDPRSSGAEAYRGMRSALMLSSIDNPPHAIVVTSALPGEGKTTTALNLAIVLAQRGERVLLVDADLRRGSLHRVFRMADQSFGLSTALTQPEACTEVPAPFPDLPMLHVLPTGPRPPNPAEMLSSNRMEEQMRQWAQQFDRIVIDTAPLLAVSDTQALAVRADAVVLVARARVTRKRALLRARNLLWRINAPLVGVVINDVDMRQENFYTYRYGVYAKNYWYGYGQTGASSDRAYGYEEVKKGK